MDRWMGLPIQAAAHAARMDFFMLAVHLVMIVAFVFWTTWFLLAIFRFRKKKHPQADYTGIKGRWPWIPVSIMVMCDFGLLFGLSLPFWHDEIADVPLDNANAVQIRVVAQQFQWNIHYPGPDRVFGRTDIALVDGQTNFIGLDPTDPASADDIVTLNQMHLPVNEEVIIFLSSKDMVHSFTLPEFRIKQDVIPGMRIPIYFKPIMSTAELRERSGKPDRNFEIACSQLCGNSHYQMRGFVTVESREDYDAWLAGKLKEKQAYEDDDWFFQE